MADHAKATDSNRIRSAQSLRAHAMLSALDQKFEVIRESAARLAMAREALTEADPEEAAACAAITLARKPQGQSSLEPVRDALHQLLTMADPAGLPYETKRVIYEWSVAEGADEVVRLLRSSTTSAAGEAQPQRLPKEVADLPLGVRRSLAKGQDMMLLAKLSLDTDPRVIAHLLDNPKLRESDVVGMAAKRPVAASTLREIGSHRRFGSMLHVRIALARNPHSPVDLAMRMLASLPLPAVREIALDPDLHSITMEQVEAELARRRLPTVVSENA